jgi:quercetin dioxygenase-like cupin family protein
MSDRVFVRGLEGSSYNLKALRQARFNAPHVVHADDRSWRDEKTPGHEDASPQSRAKYLMAPGHDPYLTQSLLAHYVEIQPGGSNGGHGHQNEAAFYILEGHGYEIHDGQRYDWQVGDLVIVHTDCRHQHFNASPDKRALALVMKAKATWLFLGLTQQGRDTTIPDGAGDRFGPREDWSQLWTPGSEHKRKVVPGREQTWQATRDGRIKWLANRDMDVRLNSLDIWLQQIAPGNHTAKHWHMADELFYVISGSGYTLEWQVEADIADRYYARVAKEPRRHEWGPTDLVYVPHNTVHQHFANDTPVELVNAQNRLYKAMGYDNVRYLADASEWARPLAEVAT